MGACRFRQSPMLWRVQNSLGAGLTARQDLTLRLSPMSLVDVHEPSS